MLLKFHSSHRLPAGGTERTRQYFAEPFNHLQLMKVLAPEMGHNQQTSLPPPNSRNRSYRLCTLFSGRVLSACLMRATFHAIVTSWNCRSMPFFGQSISRLLGPALSGFLILVLYHLGRHGFLYRVRDHPFHHSRTVFKD